MEFSTGVLILIFIGAISYPEFTLGCVLIYLGHPILGWILILDEVLDIFTSKKK